MKCNEIIDQPLLPLDEGRFNSYEELLDKEKLDNEKTQEHEWVEKQWSKLMNDKRRFGHVDKLWRIKLQQYRQAQKDGTLEKFINDEVWREG
jgi:hypothetical protein